MDVSITQGGCVETSQPTTHYDPVFTYAGVTHYCVPNIPSAVARTATHALVGSSWPIIEEVAELGPDIAIARNRMIARGTWTHRGQMLQQIVDPQDA